MSFLGISLADFLRFSGARALATSTGAATPQAKARAVILVWLEGGTLCTVPAAATGILPGATCAWLLAHAGELGFAAAERMATPQRLVEADGVWFTSSVRGLAEFRSLDATRLPRSAHTPALQALLAHPVP